MLSIQQPKKRHWMVGLAMVGALTLPLLAGMQSADAAPSDSKPSSHQALEYGGLVQAKACNDGFRLVGTHQCTTGPEPMPEELQSTAAGSGDDGVLDPSTPHAVPCYGDGTSGARLQAIYAVSSDQPDRFNEVLSLVRTSAGYADEVYSESAAQTGGVRHLRWVTDANCMLDVQKVILSPAGDDTFAATRTEVRDAGMLDANRKYVIWTDAAVYCGIATIPEDDSDSALNVSNSMTNYARIDTRCWNFVNSIEAHEITHMLGGVQLSAPHSNGAWHCTDDADLLCYDDGSGTPTTAVCEAPQEAFLDCNKDDYFNTAPEPGSYLDTHWNVADSIYLEDHDGSYPVMAESASWNWSGSLSRKIPMAEYSEQLAAGHTTITLSFTKAKSMRVSLVDADGVVVDAIEGSSPLTVNRDVSAGTWTFRVDGANNASYSLTVDGWRVP